MKHLVKNYYGFILPEQTYKYVVKEGKIEVYSLKYKGVLQFNIKFKKYQFMGIISRILSKSLTKVIGEQDIQDFIKEKRITKNTLLFEKC